MKHRVTRIAPHQAGKVAGGIAGLIALVCVPFLFLVSANIPLAVGSGALFLLLMPVVYAGLAYLWIAVICLAYNWIVGFTGELELDIEPSYAE